MCEKLVRLRVDIKCSDIDGRTALHHASYQGHLDVVRLLIEAGASIHRVSYINHLRLKKVSITKVLVTFDSVQNQS